MTGRLPARIDREAFDRVLRRAAELQAHGRDIGDGLTEAEVLALGQEVGIPEAQLRQALLEEQTRVGLPDSIGVVDRVVGPPVVAAERVVQGNPESIGAALTKWFEQNEVLVVQRNTTGKLTWEPSSSFAGAMKRMGWTLSANRSKPYLDRAELVSALITPLEPGFCHVTLMASMRRSRRTYFGSGIGVAGAVGTTGVVMVLMGAPLLIAPILVVPALVSGTAITRAYRPVAERARLGLERALDALERQPALPPGIDTARPLVRDIGDAVAQITREVRRAWEEKK